MGDRTRHTVEDILEIRDNANKPSDAELIEYVIEKRMNIDYVTLFQWQKVLFERTKKLSHSIIIIIDVNEGKILIHVPKTNNKIQTNSMSVRNIDFKEWK